MPRDGTQNYVLPFPDVVTDTTIESPVYNGFTNDVAQDLNAPRPIIAGGTGATSAAGALAALGGETASQIVTNYDSHLWKAGSFYSAAGATGAQNATNAFRGTCIITDTNNMHIEARDIVTGTVYARFKAAGVWGAWSLDGVDPATLLAVAGHQTTTGGFRFTPYTPTVGAGTTYTPDAYNGNYHWYNNVGAHTLAAPTVPCAIDILVANSVSAGAITFTGFTVGAGKTGDTLTTTGGNLFIISIRVFSVSLATYVIKALQ